ncbi:MAG: BadF/BadG/BcrA/BcrD ATPase family protein [Planctomycetota bacterium]
MSMPDRGIVGVDGGGSKTVAWLARANHGDRILGQGRAGPANLQTLGINESADAIRRAIDQAVADARWPEKSPLTVCLAVAGAGRSEQRRQLSRWASETFPNWTVVVTHDAWPVLYAFQADGVGIGLIGGTGSLAFGQDQTGNTERCGGWGPLLGDEGGGYNIAVRGLRAAVRRADGRGPETTLLERLLGELSLTSPDQLISAVYDPAMNRRQIAALAPCVLDAAQSGDIVACQIADHAGRDLAELVLSCRQGLEFRPGPIPLSITGGVLLGSKLIQDRLAAELAQRSDDFPCVRCVSDPVKGSLQIAASVAENGPARYQ